MSGHSSAKQEDNVRCDSFVAVFTAVSVPSAITVACFSAMGFGLTFYNAVAPSYMNMLGNIVGGVFTLWLCFLFVIDVTTLPKLVKYPLGFIACAMLIGASILKGMLYPWAVLLFTLFMIPGGLGLLRNGYCGTMKKSHFYRTAGISAAFCAVVIGVLWGLWMIYEDYHWSDETKERLMSKSDRIYRHVYSPMPLNYTTHCQLGQCDNCTAEEVTNIDSACSTAKTVWFMAWMAPFVAIICNSIIAAFCIFIGRYRVIDSQAPVQRILQNSVCILVFLCAGIYCSTYATGASVQVASALLGFFSAGIVAVVVWVYFEVDMIALEELAKKSRLAYWLRKAWRSDWVRAGAVSILGFIGIPLFLSLDIIRQRIRRCRGTAVDYDSLFTVPGGKRIHEEFDKWNWSGIFIKVNIIWEILFVLNIGMKLTFVFFSWLNIALWDVQFGMVSVLVFFVGLGMFMLPPVPGSAVYMFAGIVLGRKAQNPGGVGLWPGIVIACIIGLLAKLAACTGQYMIGWQLGKSVKVQKFIGVDTVPTRAIEKILRQRGLALGKVAILVGGPDWPTSVLCGILKLNIPQMLLGTLPVFIASIAPQTLMGALLTVESNSSVWSMLSAASTAVAAICQAGATLRAAYSTTQTIEKDAEELLQYRPEHEAVAELTRQEQALTQAHADVSKWQNLAVGPRTLLLTSVFLQLVAGFVFASDVILTENLCFNDFAIDSQINDPIEQSGLDGNVLNLVITPPQGPPIGWVLIVVFFVAVIIHCWLISSWGRKARLQVASKVFPDKEDETPSSPVVKVNVAERR